MRLTKVYIQSIGEKTESSLQVTVDYDPHADYVEGVVSVQAYNASTRTLTDLTEIFALQFSSELDHIIEAVDWREIYAEEKANKKELIEQE